MKTAILKARLSREEYEALRERADAAGLTLSEQVRAILARDRQAVGVEAALAQVRAMLPVPGASLACAERPDPLLAEAVWLLRELAAERNAQVLTRITSKLDAAFGRERSRI